MPPQSHDIECNCDGNDTKYLSIVVPEKDHLNLSIDTDSTSSTEVDSSFSKDSILSDDDDDSNGLQVIRQRVFRSSGFDEIDDQIWLLDEDDGSRRPLRRKRSRKLRNWFSRNYLLLPLAVVLYLVVFQSSTIHQTKDDKRWRRFMKKDAKRVQAQIQRKRTGPGYTIRLKGSRLDLLQQSLDAHTRCPSVKEVQIDYGESFPVPQTLLSHSSGMVVQAGKAPTKGILLLSEDVILLCSDIEKAFRIWKLDPSRMVGYFGYGHGDSQSLSDNYSQQTGIEPISSGGGSYSFVSDRAVFVHQLYLTDIPDDDRTYCCQLLLSMKISTMTQKPPILIKSNPTELLETGKSASESSTMGGNRSCESTCLPSWIELDHFLSEQAAVLR